MGGRLSPERLFAHELGHNMGFGHDYDAKCGKYGGDLSLLMGMTGSNRYVLFVSYFCNVCL